MDIFIINHPPLFANSQTPLEFTQTPTDLTTAQARNLKAKHTANGTLAYLVSYPSRALRHTTYFSIQAVRDARA